MNERIRELIKSIGIIPEDEHYEVAELILRDCIEEFEAVKVGDYAHDKHDAGYDDGLQQAIEVIRERFGVE